MSGDFSERMDELSRAVGHGKITSTVEVDQVYAKWQEVHSEFAHPRGGRAFYLRTALYRDFSIRMQKIAKQVIVASGSDIKKAMREHAEDTSQGVVDLAPREFQILRYSGHPRVLDEDAVIYDRAPQRARQSDAELHRERRYRNRG